jgi:arylsulfate sulfotransferase
MRCFIFFTLLFIFFLFSGCANSTQTLNDDKPGEDTDVEIPDSDTNTVFGEITLNPSGNIPLSAEIELLDNSVKEVRVTVKDPEEKSDFVRVYDLKSSEERPISIPVLGLFPDMANQVELEAFGEEGDSVGTKIFEITTPPLPRDFPEVYLSGEIDSGWTIVNWLRTPRSRPEMNAMAVDESGRIRWFTDFPFPAVFPLRIKDGNIYLSDGNEMIYKFDFMGFEQNSWDISEFGYAEIHHDIFIKDDGNILVAASKKDDVWSYDSIIEIDPVKNALRGTWDLKTVFPDVCDLYHDIPLTDPGNPVDGANAPIHNNAVWHDPVDNSIIVSSQRSGIAKITHSGYLKWFLAPGITAYIDDHDGDGMSDSLVDGYDPDDNLSRVGDFRGENYTADRMPIAGKPHEAYSSLDFRYQEFIPAPLDKNGDFITEEEVIMGFSSHDDFSWPFRPHSPVILENGNIMLFDNGLARNFSFPPISASHYSRAVEYKIVPDSENGGYGGTIQQIWEYVIEEEPSWYGFSPVVSNVDKLENGNRLIVSGSLGSSFIPSMLRPMYGEGPVGALVIEVDPDLNIEKNRLFFKRFVDEEYVVTEFSIYRAHRFELVVKVK